MQSIANEFDKNIFSPPAKPGEKVLARPLEKYWFVKIPKTDLPADFPIKPVDTVFYRRELKTKKGS